MKDKDDIFTDRKKSSKTNTTTEAQPTFLKDRRNPNNTFHGKLWYLRVNYTKHGLIY